MEAMRTHEHEFFCLGTRYPVRICRSRYSTRRKNVARVVRHGNQSVGDIFLSDCSVQGWRPGTARGFSVLRWYGDYVSLLVVN